MTFSIVNVLYKFTFSMVYEKAARLWFKALCSKQLHESAIVRTEKQRRSKNNQHKNHVIILTSPKGLQLLSQEVAPNERKSYFCLTSRRNSSLVKHASAIISSNKPLFISSCFGTGTAASSFTKIRWLPFCRAT